VGRRGNTRKASRWRKNFPAPDDWDAPALRD
jgi:hypothetical protein